MIEFLDASHRLINGVDIQLPTNTIAGPIFNVLFQTGLSFKQFEAKYRAQSLNTTILPKNGFKEFTKYVLKRDIFGNSKLELIVATGHNEIDAIATVVCLDSREFQTMNLYCQSKTRWILADHSYGMMHYVYDIQRTSIYDIRRIQLDVGKQNENVCSVGVTLSL